MILPLIVLAAGASSRMGAPKPLLDFDGSSCLSLVLRAGAASRATSAVLVLGSEAEAVRKAADREEGSRSGWVSAVVNDRFREGQTSSVKAGLEALPGNADGFILLPVDHPLVTNVEIDALIARFEARPRGRSIFVAAHENERGHPVLFAASHRAPILELGDDEPLSGYTRIRDGETEQVPVDNPGVVRDMNTPEEYRAVLALYRAGRGAARDDVRL